MPKGWFVWYNSINYLGVSFVMVYNIITAICFALLSLCVLYVIVSYLMRNRADKISFIRGFKKGKCVAVFIIAIPLLCVGYVYGGANVWDSILSSISHVVDLVVLKFNVSKVSALVESNAFYRVTLYYCCALVILNAALFALSFIGQQLWQGFNALVRLFSRKEKLFILGNNDNSVAIYNSGKSFRACIVDNFTSEQGLDLYRKKVNYISRNGFESFILHVIKSALKGKSFTLVVNTEDDEQNLRLCNFAVEHIRQMSSEQRNELFKHMRIYVFGDPRYEAIYVNIASESNGCIRYKNKYQMLAMDFIDKYPLTKFMDGRHIDYETSLIKSDVDINVCMIGFGKPNRQIFLTSAANNQFVTQTKTGVDLKLVNYHLFDKKHAENDKNLNHLYYRFKSDRNSVNPDDYLPLPSLPANEVYHHIDLNAPEFYGELRSVVSRSENDVNFVIVSFESDLDNIDMAQKLLEKRREWGVDNLVIFVRAKSPHNDRFILSEKNVFFIGNERECVYNIDCIVSDKIFRMAQMRNELYDLEYKIKNVEGFEVNPQSIEENRVAANRDWFAERTQLERESSLYCCLSLQSKLNLLNLEYCKVDANDAVGLTEDEYMSVYAKGDMPKTQLCKSGDFSKKVVEYTLDFPESLRKNLAVLEHYRWNSFMITKGLVPASKERIRNEMVYKRGELVHSNGRNYKLRRHGNLTTFDGLVEFRKLVADRDRCSELECDVIKYDYQILDDAHWLLANNGYKIIRREDKCGK